MKSRLLCIWKFCSILFNYLQGILQLLFILESPRLCSFLYQGNTSLCIIICDFLLLVLPQPRPMHSRWLAPLCGMGFLWRNDCSPGFFLTHSTPASKLFFLAVQGSGALLSSNLEEALYKSL